MLAPGTARRECTRRGADRDRGRPRDAVLAVEGALRAHARPRARAVREASAPRVRHRAAPPSGGRARRDAHRADRRQPAPGRGAAERQRDARTAEVEPADLEEEDADFGVVDEELSSPRSLRRAEDPGAVRRYRFRHPTASGKTIAAAGFVEAARTIGVLILTHRRLLVSQFNRELDGRGLRRPADPDRRAGADLAAARRRSRSRRTRGSRGTHDIVSRDTYQLVICRRGAHGARREDQRRDPQLPRARSTSG